jgi:ABC-type uncharacterized transport system permease subunit
MSTTQMSGWMFSQNTAGHHKANATSENRIRAQTCKPRMFRSKQVTGTGSAQRWAGAALPGSLATSTNWWTEGNRSEQGWAALAGTICARYSGAASVACTSCALRKIALAAGPHTQVLEARTNNEQRTQTAAWLLMTETTHRKATMMSTSSSNRY